MAARDAWMVIWSLHAIEFLTSLSESAREIGRGDHLADLLRDINSRLERDPSSVGEVYRLRGRIESHLAVIDFLSVDFTFDRKRRFVLVHSCEVLSSFGA